MSKYNSLNVKLSNSQLNELKSGIIKGLTTLNIFPNVVGDYNDEANFPHKLLLIINKFQGFIKLLQIIHQLL